MLDGEYVRPRNTRQLGKIPLGYSDSKTGRLDVLRETDAQIGRDGAILGLGTTRHGAGKPLVSRRG